MKIPIPNDWDGTSWTCYQIRWPSSVQWQAILAGLISQTARGTMYDVQTGWIPDAQAVGREILRRNWPWRDCAGLPQQPTQQEFAALGACLDCDWEALMPCIDISGLLKIENGNLYARDSCCEWILIGAIAGAVQGLGSTPLDPSGGEDPPTYSACGKATAIVNIVYKIIEGAFASCDEFPWDVISFVEGFVGYDLDNSWLLTLMVNACASLGLGHGYTDVADPIDRQVILSKLVSLFEDDPTGIDSSKFEQVKSLFKAQIYPSPDWQFFDQAINALGASDMNTVAQLGATTTGDCDPVPAGWELSYGPDGAGWYFGAPFIGGLQTNSRADAGSLAVCFDDLLAHDAYGVAFRLTWSGATGTIKRMGSGYSPDCGTPDTWVWGDTSDQIQSYPQSTWMMCAGNATIRDIMVALAAAQGQPSFGLSDSSGFSTVIATPGDGAAGQERAGVIFNTTTGAAVLTITEVRWLHNTNSPSHA